MVRPVSSKVLLTEYFAVGRAAIHKASIKLWTGKKLNWGGQSS